MFTLPLWFKVASLLWNFLNNGLVPVKAFLWAWLEFTARGTTKFLWYFFALSLWADQPDLLHHLLPLVTFLPGPFGTLCLSGVSLSNILTFLLKNSLALDNVILNIVNMQVGYALGFIDSPTFCWVFSFTKKLYTQSHHHTLFLQP